MSKGRHAPILDFLRYNSLSLTLFGLFVVFLVGEGLVGHLAYNQQRSTHGAPAVDLWAYLGTGNFLDGIFSNWQAAVLQLASLIIFGVFLTQRGATHSRKHLEPDPEHKALRQRPFGRTRSWIYRNSLFLAFLALFLGAFLLHLFSGLAQYNDTQADLSRPQASLGSYALSAEFWFKTFQTWQAEYFAIGVYMVLSIFLRQKGSPESKPVEAQNEETGESDT
jgi:hypothetical protein